MEQDREKGLLYLRIADELKGEIRSGARSPGAQLPGVRELASRFGTAPKTVGRALDELESGGYISREQGRGLFVRPEEFWIGRETREARTWACLCPLGAHPATELLVSALEEQAGLRGLELLIRRFAPGADDPAALLRALAGESVKGAVMVTSLSPEALFPSPGPGDLPLPVLVLGSFAPGPGYRGSYLVWDLARGIHSMTEYLMDRGHEKIGYLGISGSLKEDPGFGFFREAVEARGLVFRREYCRGGASIDFDSGFRAMEEVLENPDGPTAMICLHDHLAAGAMKAARRADLAIPEDISFVGCGNTETAQAVDPALTSLSLDRSMMAALALGLLELRAGNLLPGEVQLSIPLTLVERESTIAWDSDLTDKWL